MRTVHEVSELSGVSIRTLQYYDRIGLLPASRRSGAEYRLYDDAALERLREILFFRELEFPLREIRAILERPGYDCAAALAQQIELLRLKKERLEGLIALACEIQTTGETSMGFSAFDQKKIDGYKQEAKARWGETEAYRESEKRAAARGAAEEKTLADDMMAIFAQFGAVKSAAPASVEAQALVKKLQDFITANHYKCSKPILASLGAMYAAGGEMTENIDAAGGAGTAAFAAAAIEAYCR